MNSAAVDFYRDAILQTIGIACGALVLAIVIGAPLALVIVRGGISGRFVAVVVAVVRAIPELVLAIVAVVALGFGPAAGVAALGLHYAAVIAKLYAETLGGVRREAAEALRATGATATAAFLTAMLPAAWPGIVGFGAYALESIMRAAVIVGVVGAGGIGALLVQQLNLADYRGFAVSTALLIALVALVDAASSRLRARARPAFVGAAFAAIALIGVVAFAFTADPPWATIARAPQHVAAFVAGSLPPRLTAAIAATAAGGVAVTLFVAVISTLGGALLALPFAWLATAGTRAASTLGREDPRARVWAGVSRILLAVVRAAPPVAVALIGLSIVGLGPRAAIFALLLHTVGVLGKLLAESLELAERGPAQALAATGSTASAAAIVALVPTAGSVMIAHLLYRLEWNVRASTVLGMVGAGGLGQAIFNEQQLLHYQTLATYVIVAVGLVLIIDGLLARGRSRLYLRTLTG
jgi:phosphonate transport system permease protein